MNEKFSMNNKNYIFIESLKYFQIMEDYLHILKGLRDFFAGFDIKDVEMLMKFMMIGAMGGCMFLVYVSGKIVQIIYLSLVGFLKGYKGI